jgi:hypothetical protein
MRFVGDVKTRNLFPRCCRTNNYNSHNEARRIKDFLLLVFETAETVNAIPKKDYYSLSSERMV